MSGGIKAWQGQQARGPVESGLEAFTGQEEFDDGVSLAYAMEDGLQAFYRTMAGRAEEDDERQLYTRLMGFEDRHKARLLTEYQQAHGPQALPGKGEAGLMEGGGRLQDFLAQAEDSLRGRRQILEFSMALEIQALDLYSRMAQKSSQPEVKALFLRLADEEKMHLAWLADELDKAL